MQPHLGVISTPAVRRQSWLKDHRVVPMNGLVLLALDLRWPFSNYGDLKK